MPTPSWLAPLLTRKMLICVFTGFSSGLPLYLLISLVPAWLTGEGVNIKTIGLFALVQLPFALKFIWAPLLDRFVPPLGRRRGWMLISQVGLLIFIGLLGGFNPQGQIGMISALAILLAFLGATQDVALDAFRREILTDAELGLGSSVHVNAYRVAGLVPGSLSLVLADLDWLSWAQVFWITALFMLPGMLMSLFVREPAVTGRPKTLQEACVEPFKEFVGRLGWQGAMLFLGFLLLYKLGDSLATALSTPFYLTMGFSKTDIGLIAKHAGLWPAVIGGMAGGLMMVKIGINRALWLFGAVQLVTILGFAWLAWLGPFEQITLANRLSLALVIAAEYLGVGLGTAAFTAFIARATHPAYTATQFALFTSLTAVPRTTFNAFSGVLVECLGWVGFFLLCTLLAVPGMLLLFKVAPWGGQESGIRAQESEFRERRRPRQWF
ncbi:AmpG family muropeptide MFS transporter [Betaproteobacteria bacterium]|nr:AmpG family muropeptide MFS transporter [Betaproteobacteria bacterium]GHU45156.1 AmpG family muropeptide MFS transporter [Betaproteobacteria bacterium]